MIATAILKDLLAYYAEHEVPEPVREILSRHTEEKSMLTTAEEFKATLNMLRDVSNAQIADLLNMALAAQGIDPNKKDGGPPEGSPPVPQGET